jgi:phage tail sheath protein FI
MPEYLSPGVYVEEVPSAIKPIAGVSTSTACFLGIVPDLIFIPKENPDYDPTGKGGDENKRPFVLTRFEYSPKALQEKKDALVKAQADVDQDDRRDRKKTDDLADKLRKAQEAVESLGMAKSGVPILCTTFSDFKKSFGGFSINGLYQPGQEPEDVKAELGKIGAPAGPPAGGPEAAALITQNQLAHAVYGFFNNGGTRCYVVRYDSQKAIADPEALHSLEAIDEIALVAAPGITLPDVQQAIVDHCTNMSDRFAILDVPKDPANLTRDDINSKKIKNTDYAAVYFPWIRVSDIAKKLTDPRNLVKLVDDPGVDGEIAVAPSGHVAGIYARVDHERGVHKAPANEVVRGALDVDIQISKAIQDGLNPSGINCIRYINDRIAVWGARTLGGNANLDLKYINVRRTLLFLRESIDEGTQWVVFEPNDRSLWAKIVRNVTAFLTSVWRDGALFGSTPQEAFYVKCDDETNPPEERELGKVTTEIGVAIVRPAEFVIFHISQWAGPQNK